MPDLRDAWRTLRATPVISTVAVLSLALGIGANTAIFSIMNSLLIRTLPVKDPGGLVQVLCGGDRVSWTNPLWEALRNQPELFDGAFAWSTTRFNLAEAGEAQFAPGMWASGRLFDVLGVQAMLGRTLTAADDARGGGPDGAVAVISYGLWQRRFAGASNVLGKTVAIERVPFRIVGVTPPEFFGLEVGARFDVVIPIGAEPLIRGKESYLDRRSTWWLRVIARLKPQQSIDAGIAALRGAQPGIRETTLPDGWRADQLKSYMTDPFTLRPSGAGTSFLRARYQQPLFILMGVVGLVLLIACANVANVLLARAAARRHELSVRLALGASRWRLARQLLAESVLLAGLGAALGVGFALWGSRLLVAQLSTHANLVFLDLSLDWRVLGFTMAVAIATAVLFGTAPALRASRIQPMEAIKEQGRTVAAEAQVGLGSALVVAQIALSLMLVVAAGLFVRTFASLATMTLGFDRDPVLVVDINARTSAPDPSVRNALYLRALAAARAVPGVATAALSVITPVSGSMWNTTIENPPGLSLTEPQRETYINHVSPDWFRAYGVPLIAGRDFTDADRHDTSAVGILNETAARRYFPHANPVGQSIREVGGPQAATPPIEIVGVVKDAIYGNLREVIPATLYRPLVQERQAEASTSLSVRAASGAPARLTRSLAAALSGVDQNLALTFQPLADQIKASFIRERLLAMLSGFFGGVALLLAGIGLYGVMSYAVTRRRTEIGVRMALGATPGDVMRLVLRRVALLVVCGVAIGGALSLWLARFIGTLLFSLQARDPVTLATAALVLAAVGGIASSLPAWRASRIDPTTVLREG